MLPSNFYRVENVYRTRHALIATAIAAALICIYLLAATVLDMRKLHQTQGSLRTLKAGSAELADKAELADLQQALCFAQSSNVDAFAVRLASWADSRNVRLESLIPEGIAAEVEVNNDGKLLGKWKANKIGAQGHGRFEDVMYLLGVLRSSHIPVQLESFSLQSFGDGGNGSVAFQLLLTVYENKNRTD